MLKYIEKSTVENITNQDIESVSKLVNKVKKRKEVGISYMKSWEIEQMARNEGYTLGTDRINRLNIRLIEEGRTEDVIKAAKDTDYQNALLEELGL